MLRPLEAVRAADLSDVRLLPASSAAMFGRATGALQDEDTPLRPASPYGAAKVLAHDLAGNYREAYGLHASRAILIRHESPRRGPEFVTRKITRGVAAISLGQASEIRLGNLDLPRKQGHAADYVEGIWLALQQDEPGDCVLAGGQTRSLQEFLALAFRAIGIEDWPAHVVQEPAFFRPAEPDALCGDASRAHSMLGWTPVTPPRSSSRRWSRPTSRSGCLTQPCGVARRVQASAFAGRDCEPSRRHPAPAGQP